MGGKITASKFRAQIRTLKSAYAEAMKAMHQEITSKEQALSIVKLLKATVNAKEEVETNTSPKAGEVPDMGPSTVINTETEVSPNTTTKSASKVTNFSWAEVTRKRKPATKEQEHLPASVEKPIQPHTNDLKSHDCEKCNKTCTSQDDLRRHIYARHEALECHLCEETINSRKELNHHKTTKHNITKVKTCKFFILNSCLNNDECLYSHTKPTENEGIEGEEYQTKNTDIRKKKRQVVCKRGKKCNRECEFLEEAHMNIRDVLCHFQEDCTKATCPFKHNVNRKLFLGIGLKTSKRT